MRKIKKKPIDTITYFYLSKWKYPYQKKQAVLTFSAGPLFSFPSNTFHLLKLDKLHFKHGPFFRRQHWSSSNSRPSSLALNRSFDEPVARVHFSPTAEHVLADSLASLRATPSDLLLLLMLLLHYEPPQRRTDDAVSPHSQRSTTVRCRRTPRTPFWSNSVCCSVCCSSSNWRRTVVVAKFCKK